MLRTGTNGWHVKANSGLRKNVTSTKLQDNEHGANHRHLGANAELEETVFWNQGLIVSNSIFNHILLNISKYSYVSNLQN